MTADQLDDRAAGILSRFDATTSAALSLMLQGQDPTPVVGVPTTAEQAAVVGAVLSTCRAAVQAVYAAAACTAHSDDNVMNIDTARLWNAMQALMSRAASHHARADQMASDQAGRT